MPKIGKDLSSYTVICPSTTCCNENKNGSLSPNKDCDKEKAAKYEKIIDNLILHGITIYGMKGCGISIKSYKNLYGSCVNNISKIFKWIPSTKTGPEWEQFQASLLINKRSGQVSAQWPVVFGENNKIVSGIYSGLTTIPGTPLTLEQLQKDAGIKDIVKVPEYFTNKQIIRGKTTEIISRDYFKVISNNKILFITLGIIFIILIGLAILFLSSSKSKLKR